MAGVTIGMAFSAYFAAHNGWSDDVMYGRIMELMERRRSQLYIYQLLYSVLLLLLLVWSSDWVSSLRRRGGTSCTIRFFNADASAGSLGVQKLFADGFRLDDLSW